MPEYGERKDATGKNMKPELGSLLRKEEGGEMKCAEQKLLRALGKKRRLCYT